RATAAVSLHDALPIFDWLACELQSDWDIKRFLKLLVTSAAYRQSAKVTPAQFERDPENRLLARGPRVRLTAEMVRDQALFAAGRSEEHTSELQSLRHL